MGENRQGVTSFNPPAGLIKTGTIVSYDPGTNMMQVQLAESPAIKGKKPLPVAVPANFPVSDSNGAFMGTLPSKGTTVTVGQSSGGQYYFVGFAPQNPANLPDIQPGQMKMHTTDTSHITMDDSSHINIGSDTNSIHVFAGSQQFPKGNLVTTNFENFNNFTQAAREITGLVKRDLRPNPQAASFTGDTKLEDDSYDAQLSFIGMDPTATANDLMSGPTKNPPLVESRKIVYEFQYNSSVVDDLTESNNYGSGTPSAPPIYTTPNRRSSRADTMSLSLVAPNYLLEEVNGTVVDIYGNILDLNRSVIPVGGDPTTTIQPQISTNQQQSYLNIRALERRSVAHHLEINARKDPNYGNTLPTQVPLDINADNYNAKLLRSRFSFDIDKEGQFRLNVPASSETGNIPLLVRHENYSTFGTTDSSNPNQSWATQTGQGSTSQDIFVDSFAAYSTTPISPTSGFNVSTTHGSITLMNGTTNAGPTDRISQFMGTPYNIQHGTAYHDIVQTCFMQQNNDTINGYSLKIPVTPVDTSAIMPLTNVVSNTIKLAGSGTPESGGANAGGRSGSVNLDGSLEVNIGANTIDRQSLWLDTAGGIVANVGRDQNSRSGVISLDGDLIVSIGGFGITADSRFVQQNNGAYNAVLDLRVYAAGFAHMIRIDPTGVTVMTPSKIQLYAAQGIAITSDSDISVDCSTLTLQGRLVRKNPPNTPAI